MQERDIWQNFRSSKRYNSVYANLNTRELIPQKLCSGDQCATYESKRVHINNLFRMVHYCENVADCRRSQVLHYFGEHHFDREHCNVVPGALCDNCKSKVQKLVLCMFHIYWCVLSVLVLTLHRSNLRLPLDRLHTLNTMARIIQKDILHVCQFWRLID